MGDALEAELDALFQLPPAQLVSARNALARRLKQAGDKAAASRVADIRRPTPAAWAINQVHFHEPGLLSHVEAQTARLRELHATHGVDGGEVSAALAARGAALQAVVGGALRRCAAAGVGSGATLERQIHASLQAWLAGTADEAPGRMTRDLEPSGFEVLGEVGAVAKPAASSPPAQPSAAERAQPAAASAQPDPRLLEQAIEDLARREREAREASELARARTSELTQADKELQRAQLAVEDAERALTGQRTRLQEHEASTERARGAAAEAQAAQTRAEQAVAQARAALSALRPRR